MPIEMQEQKSFGPSGIAEVRVLANKVKIIFQADGDIYEIGLDGWPEGRPAGNYFIGLNKERTKASIIRPMAGTYFLKFKEFKRQGQSELPEPHIQRGGPRKGKNNSTWWADDELRYTAVMEVQFDPMYSGLTVTKSIPYIWTPKAGTNEAMLVGKPRAVTDNDKFLRTAGLNFLTDSVYYTPNVLPQLERLLQERGVIFQGVVSDKGFLDDVTSTPAGWMPPVVAKKAPAKKAK